MIKFVQGTRSNRRCEVEGVMWFFRKSYKLIIMDIDMPDLDGIETSKILIEFMNTFSINTKIIITFSRGWSFRIT